jgi:competence protein ComFB
MAFLDNYDFVNLKNEAESLVFRQLEEQLAENAGTACVCNDCVADMAALALNTVKPLYRYSLLGGLYAAQAMEDDGYAQSVRAAVHDAIMKVQKNPSHPPIRGVKL